MRQSLISAGAVGFEGRATSQDHLGPLIKWPGGKTSELRLIRPLIPRYGRYFEPFFGGGALFFQLCPKRAIINDRAPELMAFYTFVRDKNPTFREELFQMVKHWKRIGDYLRVFGADLSQLYVRYRSNEIDDSGLENSIGVLFEKRIVPFNGMFDRRFCIEPLDLGHHMKANLIAKMKRMKRAVDVRQRFDASEVQKNVETALRSGFYMHFREILNADKRGTIVLTSERRLATYYFIREFCYGSMFRYNSQGEFNIPYGGIAYNAKDFDKKAQHLFSNAVADVLARATIECGDFETVFHKHRLTEDDFVFVDPPYDSDFSSYEENAFTKSDHSRLAGLLGQTPAKVLAVIADTPFIRSLYQGNGFAIDGFEKRYLYNVRGRNNQRAKHLMITNYQLPTLRQ